MFTDIVGYTALMGSDEIKAFEMLRENREIHKTCLKQYGGEWLKEMGDGILASFNNSSDAVRCAGAIQLAAGKKGISIKIALHQGEVVFENGDVLGDGVNVASRLEQIAKEGEIIISASIFNDVKNKRDIRTEYIGEQKLKNVEEPVQVYKAFYQPSEPVGAGKGYDQLRPLKSTSILKKRIPYYITGGLLIIILFLLVWYNFPKRSVAVTDRSIIVLPFKNDSPDQENEYFCNGMMEEILTNLQMIGDLRVKSRTTAEKYRYRSYDITDIGAELNVAFVLEGSVRKVEDNIRITAQLIDAKTGDHIWAEIYDGEYSDRIFEFQSRTARNIATSLNAIITPDEEKRINRTPTEHILAYDLSLKGNEYLSSWEFTKDSTKLMLANIFAAEALQIDPEYIGAMDLKARCSMYKGNYDSALYFYNRISQIDPTHYLGYSGKGHLYMLYLNDVDSAFKYLVKGIQLAPNNPWTNLTLAQIYGGIKNDVIRALPFFERAYELDGESSSVINFQIASAMASIGDYPSALKYMKTAMDIRKECALVGNYSYLLICQTDYDAAVQFLDSICPKSQCEKICIRQKFVIAMIQGNIEKAEEHYHMAPETPNLPRFLDALMNACFFLESGRTEEGISILDDLIKIQKDLLNEDLNRRDLTRSYWMLSGAYALLNDKVKAIHYLSKLEESGFFAGMQDFIMIFPAFENLWEDPQFNIIMKRVRDKKTRLREQVNEMRSTGEIHI
jgi:TolB-like protein/Tfp pilus assembly protein PilF